MDTTLWPYRLKTARRKKRLQKSDLDKKLLRMERELNQLELQRGEMPMVPLDEPYQRGWLRLFVLKPEVRNSPKAEFWQQILDKINTKQYHFDRSFKRRKHGKRYLRCDYEKLPHLKTIDSYNWASNKARFTDEQREYFKRVDYWNEAYYRWETYYKFTHPEFFEMVVVPNIITEVRLVDGGLDRDIDYLHQLLYGGQHSYRFGKIKGRAFKYLGDMLQDLPKYTNPLKNVPLHLMEDAF